VPIEVAYVNRRFWLAALASIALLFVVLIWARRVPDASDVALLGAMALADGRPERALRYVPQSDLDLFGITQDQVHRFAREYVGPRMAGYRRGGAPKVETSIRTGQAWAEVPVVDGNGSISGVHAEAIRNSDGVWLSSYIQQMTMIAAHQGHDLSGERDNRARALRIVRAERDALESYGIGGTIRNGRFMSWQEFIDDVEARLQRQPVVR
jgi:hypothetical protein